MFDCLGNRLKEMESFYESTLPTHTPVIMRLDGKAFHTFTRGFDKPFDQRIHNAMSRTTAVLCKEIQNARFGYTQSDEISILIYEKRPESGQWLGNRIQKMVSVAASVCTAEFNRALCEKLDPDGDNPDFSMEGPKAYFDARVFSIAPKDVPLYFEWRHEDCVRNSISMLAQSVFSHRKLHKKNRREMQEMLQSKGVEWKDLDDWKRNGSTIIKQWREKEGPNGEIAQRSFWASIPKSPVFSTDVVFFEKQLEREEVTNEV